MADLQATAIADLVKSTLNNLGRAKMTDVMSTYQNTIVFKRLFKKNKLMFDGGTECEFNLITGTNESARSVGLYYQAVVNPTNVLTKGKMDWKHWTFNWSFDHREISMNSGSANKIFDLLKTRRIAALADQVLFVERLFWRLQSSTSSDFAGIPYWIVKSATATTTNDGFNGGLPSGHSTVANIVPSTPGITPKWNNYTDIYTDVSNDDLVNKLERASDYTNFQPLVDNIPTYNVGDDYMYCTTRSVRYQLKEILKGQNDNLGFDIDPVGNKLMFRRTPFVWVKELDQDTTGPIYGINWGTFFVKVLSGWWQHETVNAHHDNQPTVGATHVDTTANTYCVDRRRNFVLATAATLP
jgi:hypothetical protein